ncbi:hypothetical protein LEN26_011759 [Aphanomyces euteiches]|nr:hypothetical protein LEN26_011759 [Aphanomyces euteiches]
MVKISERQIILPHAVKVLERRRCMRLCRELLDEDDSDEDDADLQLVAFVQSIECQRYFASRSNDSFKSPRFHHFLFEVKATRFRKLFRLERRSFYHIVDLIKFDPVFASTTGKQLKSSVRHHLLVFLYFLGTNGNAVSNEHLATFFGVGAGTINLLLLRWAPMTTVSALCCGKYMCNECSKNSYLPDGKGYTILMFHLKNKHPTYTSKYNLIRKNVAHVTITHK